MIVLISTFKPFLPEFAVEQTNALKSWKLLRCKPKIVIIGDDYGVAEICKQEEVIHHPEVAKTKWGTPVVGDIFTQGWKYASDTDICIFVNGDIILSNTLCDAIDMFVEKYPNYNSLTYLLTAYRHDWVKYWPINFTDEKWEQTLNQMGEIKQATSDCIDLFIHRKNTLQIPDSGIAKYAYDSYIISWANLHFDLTVDISGIAKIYHQLGKLYQDNKVYERDDKNLEKCSELNDNGHRIRMLMLQGDMFKHCTVESCHVKL